MAAGQARWIGAGLLLGAVLIPLVSPQTEWLAFAARQLSGGSWQLEHGDGDLWLGEAALSWHPPGGPARPLGRWHWAFTWQMPNGPGWQVQIDDAQGAQGHFQLHAGLGSVVLRDLSLHLPAALLHPGPPLWELLQATGECRLDSPAVRISDGRMDGTGQLQMLQGASPQSTIRPLGSWQADWSANGAELQFQLQTLQGPLHLEGQGRLGLDGRLGLQGRAWSEPAAGPALEPVMRLLGPLREDGSVAIDLPWPLPAQSGPAGQSGPPGPAGQPG